MSANMPGDASDPNQDRNFEPSNLSERLAAQEALLLLGSRRFRARQELVNLLNSSSPEAPADPEKVQPLVEEDARIGREALDLILQLIDSIGFPTSELVGEKAAAYAWDFLSIQDRIPNEEIQRINYAIQLQPECDIPNRNMRTLFQDRTMIQISDEQLYGSIWITLSIGSRKLLVPYTIVDIESVDKRRAALGLSSLLTLALVRLAPDADGEVLLPAAYAYNLVPWDQASTPKGLTGSDKEENTTLVQGTGAWLGVPAELLRRRARLADFLVSAQSIAREIAEGDGSDESIRDRISEIEKQIRTIPRDNFEYLLELCRNPELGFPTDDKVGKLAARAAFEIVLTYGMRNGDSLEEVLNAAIASCKHDSVEYPGPAELASLTDMQHFYQEGLQIYGATWLSADQSTHVIAPVQTKDIANIDSRRASMQLGPWYEYAIHLGEILGASAHLPLDYFETLLRDDPTAKDNQDV